MRKKPEIREIIWDADNTFWNWIRYASKAYPAMAQLISNTTDKPLPEVKRVMKEFYTLAGTIESPYLIQGVEAAGFFKDTKLSRSDIAKLTRNAQRTFNHIRNRYLKLFPGIRRVVQASHDKKIKNHVVTDAPSFQAGMRLRRSKLTDYLSSVHAKKYPDLSYELPAHIRTKHERGIYKLPFEIQELEHEKPDTRIEDILELIGTKTSDILDYCQSHVAIIGDNESKDMALAKKYKCALGILALWGKADPDEIAIISEYAPEQIIRKNVDLNTLNNEAADNIIPIQKKNIKKDLYNILNL
ncbi:hypothetical protein GF340_02180 [Candidatus Peregrinibacteria bacterium]|nr:hypothetical protein [Candidatus Peregrinibacteria bacterium]